MAEFSWPPRSPVESALKPGRHGVQAGNPGVSLTELRNFELVQVMARRGRWVDVAAAVKTRLGASPPDAPRGVQAQDATLIWSGPDQFLVLSKDRRQTMEALRPALSGAASLSDRSHAHALIRISGSRARAMLAKLSSIDLHPAAFPIGSAAATSIDHTGVHLWRADDAADADAVFNLLVFATFAESLLNTMLDAAAEYGAEIGHADAAAR